MNALLSMLSFYIVEHISTEPNLATIRFCKFMAYKTAMLLLLYYIEILYRMFWSITSVRSFEFTIYISALGYSFRNFLFHGNICKSTTIFSNRIKYLLPIITESFGFVSMLFVYFLFYQGNENKYVLPNHQKCNKIDVENYNIWIARLCRKTDGIWNVAYATKFFFMPQFLLSEKVEYFVTCYLEYISWYMQLWS